MLNVGKFSRKNTDFRKGRKRTQSILLQTFAEFHVVKSNFITMSYAMFCVHNCTYRKQKTQNVELKQTSKPILLPVFGR